MLEKFDKEINNFKNTTALREAVAELLDDCKQHARWQCERAQDEDGNWKKDEDGNYIYIEPNEDSYAYQLMTAYLNLAKIIAKTV